MVLFVLLAVLAFAVVGLYVPVRLRFSVRVDRFRPSFFVETASFYRLIKLRLRGFLACMPFGGTRLWVSVNGGRYRVAKRKPGKQKKEKPGRRADAGALVRTAWGGISVDALFVRCGVGVEEDAYKTVLVCGAIRIFFENLLWALPQLKNGGVSVRPDFKVPVFWLKVEGILTIHPTQIIGAVLKYSLKRLGKNHKKGKQNVASH